MVRLRRPGSRASRWECPCCQQGSPGHSLIVAALQVELRCTTKEYNLDHVEGLLDAGLEGRCVDVILLPELAFVPFDMDPSTAWLWAECLEGDPHQSPTLMRLSEWACRWQCYIGCTLMEASSDGHIYNTFVMARPDGSFVSNPAGSGAANGSSIMRKCRASSMEAFVFHDGASNPGALLHDMSSHVFEIEVAPLMAKRQQGGGQQGGGQQGGGAGGTEGGGGDGSGEGRLRIGVMICYENMLHSCVMGLAASGQQLDLLLAPFCCIRPDDKHAVYSVTPQQADWMEQLPRSCAAAHARRLATHVLLSNHSGAWHTQLPPLLPGAPRPPPFDSSFSGRSAILSPSGEVLAEVPREGEGLILAALPLLPPPEQSKAAAAGAGAALGVATSGGSGSDWELLRASSGNASIAGMSVEHAGSSGGGAQEGITFSGRRYFGDQLMDPPVPATVRYGFSFMERMGQLSYWWQGRWRRELVAAIVRDGAWKGEVAPWGGLAAGAGGAGSSSSYGVWCAVAGIAVVLAGAAVVIKRGAVRK